MKKILLLLVFYCMANTAIAQTFSCGILLGVRASSSASQGSPTFITNNEKIIRTNFGAYVEYNFTEKLGIKTEFLLHKTTLKLSGNSEGDLNLNMLEINPNMKLDFGTEYRKGGYLIAGPRITLLNKVTYEGEKMNEDFNKTLFGIQAGIGTRMLHYVDLEFKLNYDFTSFYKNPVTNNNDFFLGANLNIGIDIERLINKK